jgi:ribosomal protein S18 acetylase RimI-like enzyme
MSDANSGVRIRRATINDLAALVELENASFASDRLNGRQWRHHLQSLSAYVLVATSEHRLVGAAVLFFRSGTRVARLYSIAIAHNARGHGLGVLLLAAGERAARRRGSERLRLEVRTDNDAARRLYEGQGYRRIGALDAYYEDGAPAWRYEKLLEAGPSVAG